MWCIDNPYTDPGFNLAAEEYLFKSVSLPVCMVWQNEPCVVIGKHQDAAREVNLPLAGRRRIRVVRRITGGGAVYHDEGNLNLTLIGPRELVMPATLPERMRDFLLALGLDARVDDRKNVRIGRFKVSGSAQGVYKDRWLFHATLLFSTDLHCLDAVLRAGEGAYPASGGFAVESVRSAVANVSAYLPQYVSFPGFRRRLRDYVFDAFPTRTLYRFTPADLAAIGRLKDAKYDSVTWNYGFASRPSLPVESRCAAPVR